MLHWLRWIHIRLQMAVVRLGSASTHTDQDEHRLSHMDAKCELMASCLVLTYSVRLDRSSRVVITAMQSLSIASFKGMAHAGLLCSMIAGIQRPTHHWISATHEVAKLMGTDGIASGVSAALAASLSLARISMPRAMMPRPLPLSDHGRMLQSAVQSA